jgi:hypothetical protein
MVQTVKFKSLYDGQTLPDDAEILHVTEDGYGDVHCWYLTQKDWQ